MKTWLLQWIKANSVILLNAGSLVGSTAVTSILGFGYWWVAARTFRPEDVGIASAGISAMMLLGTFCVLGLGTLLITELPRQPEQAVSLIGTAVIVVASTSACIGACFALIAPFFSAGFNPLRGSIADVCIFAAGVSLTSVTLVLDQACIGMLRGGLQLWRNTLFSAAKLAVLFPVSLWVSQDLGMSIYATWACGNALSLGVLVVFMLNKRRSLKKGALFQWTLLRRLGLEAVKHHMLNLTLQAPTFLLPVIVTALLSAKMNAWFYVSWMLANFVFLVPIALTTVLHATNSAQPATLSHKARVTMSLSLAVSLVAEAVLLFDTQQLLGLFGSSYADQASWCLRILALAAFPLIIKNHYISICRIQDRIGQAMLGMTPGGLLEVAGAVMGAYLGGLSGLSLGWILAIYIEAAFMFPTVYKVVRPSATVPEITLDEFYMGQEDIWLVDTVVMPAIPRSRQPQPIEDFPASWYQNNENSKQDTGKFRVSSIRSRP